MSTRIFYKLTWPDPYPNFTEVAAKLAEAEEELSDDPNCLRFADIFECSDFHWSPEKREDSAWPWEMFLDLGLWGYWGGSERYLARVSHAWPEVLFTLGGAGDEDPDYVRVYHQGGRYQEAIGEVVYPTFDPPSLIPVPQDPHLACGPAPFPSAAPKDTGENSPSEEPTASLHPGHYGTGAMDIFAWRIDDVLDHLEEGLSVDPEPIRWYLESLSERQQQQLDGLIGQVAEGSDQEWYDRFAVLSEDIHHDFLRALVAREQTLDELLEARGLKNLVGPPADEPSTEVGDIHGC